MLIHTGVNGGLLWGRGTTFINASWILDCKRNKEKSLKNPLDLGDFSARSGLTPF